MTALPHAGDFPQDLCDANGTDSLSELILASNPLHGSIDIYSCENLILLNMIVSPAALQSASKEWTTHLTSTTVSTRAQGGGGGWECL